MSNTQRFLPNSENIRQRSPQPDDSWFYLFAAPWGHLYRTSFQNRQDLYLNDLFRKIDEGIPMQEYQVIHKVRGKKLAVELCEVLDAEASEHRFFAWTCDAVKATDRVRYDRKLEQLAQPHETFDGFEMSPEFNLYHLASDFVGRLSATQASAQMGGRHQTMRPRLLTWLHSCGASRVTSIAWRNLDECRPRSNLALSFAGPAPQSWHGSPPVARRSGRSREGSTDDPSSQLSSRSQGQTLHDL